MCLGIYDDFPKLVLDDTRALPIRRIYFATPPPKRTALLESLKEGYHAAMNDISTDTSTGVLKKTQEPWQVRFRALLKALQEKAAEAPMSEGEIRETVEEVREEIYRERIGTRGESRPGLCACPIT